MSTPVAHLPKVESERIRQSARGQPCALRLPGCLRMTETVVLAHLRGPGTGMGSKPCDTQAIYACAFCHDVLDRRRPSPLPWGDVGWEVVRAMSETKARLIEAGHIVVPGGKIR